MDLLPGLCEFETKQGHNDALFIKSTELYCQSLKRIYELLSCW